MFGISFIFAAALWALPLAGLPILLHLLFRKKSPVVVFSTLRFIRSSLQHTAARRRVQRWMLLVTRALLMALLIWAVAQPAKIISSRWADPSKSLIAAIVIDTSYSMQFNDGQLTLLNRADGIVQELLRNQLKDARIAIYRSQPAPPDQPEQLQTAAAIQSQWTPLAPQPAPVPLGDRVAAAIAMLNEQSASQKWLIVLSDLQSREFSQPLPSLPGGRILMLDLHPDEARSAGITRVCVQPEQTLPGIHSEIGIELSGRAGETRAVNFSVCAPDQTSLLSKPPQMANFDTTGRAQIRFTADVPARRFMLLKAVQQLDDPLAWAKERSHLIETPPRQIATVLDPPPGTPAPLSMGFVRLALDPSEGTLPSWPVAVRRGDNPTGQENVVVAVLSQWPDQFQLARLSSFARSGGILVLCLQPGLEESWSKLTERQRTLLLELLPSATAASSASGVYHALIASDKEPLFKNFGSDKDQVNSILVRRFVPMAFTAGSDPDVRVILNLTATEPGVSSTRRPPLLLARKVGDGLAYTLTTLPDSRYTNLATHPMFLPLLINLCLRPIEFGYAQNVELGNPLILANPSLAALPQIEIRTPRGESYILKPADGRFVFTQTSQPGIYTWHKPGENAPLAITNVQYPAAEAELIYRAADTIVPPGPATLIARSLADMETKVAQISEPEPRWSGPICIVLFLLCLEAWMASVSKLWKPADLLSFFRAPASVG